jgi:hypothetical protein
MSSFYSSPKNQNDQGRVVPVWGTCLGHELLAYLTADFDSKVSTMMYTINTLHILKKDSDMFSN